LDRCLANMFTIPDHAMGPCLREIRKILQQIATEPQGFCARNFVQYSSKPQFEKLVGRYPPAVTLLCLAGFKEEAGNASGSSRRLAFVGDPKSDSFFAVLTTLQRLTAEEPPLVPIDLDDPESESSDEIVHCGTPSRTQEEIVSFSRKPCRLTTLPPISDSSHTKKHADQSMKSNPSNMILEKSKSAITSKEQNASKTKSLAANWGVVRPGPGNGTGQQSARPPLLSSTEQCKSTTDFDVLVQKALDGTNLHRAKKGLAPLTTLRCSTEESSCTGVTETDDVWTGDVVTIPDDSWTQPNVTDKDWIPKPVVSEGRWTAEVDSEKQVKQSHNVPAIFSGKGKLRGSKARATRRGKPSV